MTPPLKRGCLVGQRPKGPAPRRCRRGARSTSELKRPGVTLQLLWTEYRATDPTGYAYSHFCDRYRQWARALKPSMRQVHRAGEKTFVDFSGQRPSLVDATTGALVPVELFVGVLGASGLIYSEATRSHALPCWIEAHIHMAEAVGGTAR
jgi:transposase